MQRTVKKIQGFCHTKDVEIFFAVTGHIKLGLYNGSNDRVRVDCLLNVLNWYPSVDVIIV